MYWAKQHSVKICTYISNTKKENGRLALFITTMYNFTDDMGVTANGPFHNGKFHLFVMFSNDIFKNILLHFHSHFLFSKDYSWTDIFVLADVLQLDLLHAKKDSLSRDNYYDGLFTNGQSAGQSSDVYIEM